MSSILGPESSRSLPRRANSLSYTPSNPSSSDAHTQGLRKPRSSARIRPEGSTGASSSSLSKDSRATSRSEHPSLGSASSPAKELPPSSLKRARSTGTTTSNSRRKLLPSGTAAPPSSYLGTSGRKERRARALSTTSSRSSNSFTDIRTYRIRLRVRARLIARQLAAATTQTRESLIKIQMESAYRSKQKAEDALKEVLLAKAWIEAQLEDTQRELKDTRGQLEECQRDKESLTIENAMLVEELAHLKRPSRVSLRNRASSNTLRPRSAGSDASNLNMSPSRRARTRSSNSLLEVPPPTQTAYFARSNANPLTPIPQSPLIFADEKDSMVSHPPSEPVIPMFSDHVSFLADLDGVGGLIQGKSLFSDAIHPGMRRTTSGLSLASTGTAGTARQADPLEDLRLPVPVSRPRGKSLSTISHKSSYEDDLRVFPPLPPVPSPPSANSAGRKDKPRVRRTTLGVIPSSGSSLTESKLAQLSKGLTRPSSSPTSSPDAPTYGATLTVGTPRRGPVVPLSISVGRERGLSGASIVSTSGRTNVSTGADKPLPDTPSRTPTPPTPTSLREPGGSPTRGSQLAHSASEGIVDQRKGHGPYSFPRADASETTGAHPGPYDHPARASVSSFHTFATSSSRTVVPSSASRNKPRLSEDGTAQSGVANPSTTTALPPIPRPPRNPNRPRSFIDLSGAAAAMQAPSDSSDRARTQSATLLPPSAPIRSPTLPSNRPFLASPPLSPQLVEPREIPTPRSSSGSDSTGSGQRKPSKLKPLFLRVDTLVASTSGVKRRSSPPSVSSPEELSLRAETAGVLEAAQGPTVQRSNSLGVRRVPVPRYHDSRRTASSSSLSSMPFVRRLSAPAIPTSPGIPQLPARPPRRTPSVPPRPMTGSTTFSTTSSRSSRASSISASEGESESDRVRVLDFGNGGTVAPATSIPDVDEGGQDLIVPSPPFVSDLSLLDPSPSPSFSITSTTTLSPTSFPTSSQSPRSSVESPTMPLTPDALGNLMSAPPLSRPPRSPLRRPTLSLTNA